MSCEEARKWLDEYVEGALGEEARAAVAGHMEACAACREEARSLAALIAAAARLPREIRPPQNLWAGIDARLAAPVAATRSGLPGWALAAAAVALVVVTAAMTTFLTRRYDGAPPTAGREEARFLAASQDLLAGLESQDLAPETMAIVRHNLAVIDAAIAELQAALARDPENGELTRMLLATYQRKIDLLEQAARSEEG